MSGLPFNKEQMIKPSLLGNREQMRTVLQLAAEGKVRTVVDRFPMEQATEVLEFSPAASCAPAASWRTFRNIDLETVVLLLQRARTLKTSP